MKRETIYLPLSQADDFKSVHDCNPEFARRVTAIWGHRLQGRNTLWRCPDCGKRFRFTRTDTPPPKTRVRL